MPTHINFLWDTAEAARSCTRGDIRLAYCRVCGLISNIAFDARRLEYREGYENSLHHSPVFQEYAEWLAARLITDFDLRGKHIVEIGSGDGRFLRLLCQRGDNHGTGFDPSYVEDDESAEDERVMFVKDLYDERHGDVDCDFVLCRQTLEHVPRPGEMLASLRRSLVARPNVPVFFEVPNGLYTLHNLFVWDIIYEHVSYFTEPALETAFARAGFRVYDAFEAFGGQYLCVAARVVDAPPAGQVSDETAQAMERDIGRFESRYRAYVEGWRSRIDDLTRAGKAIALWGGGSKGITFLNMFDLRERVRCVVDLNPRKQGKYVTGQGQRIVAPERLPGEAVDIVIVANPIYRQEIADMTRQLGIEPEFLYL